MTNSTKKTRIRIRQGGAARPLDGAPADNGTDRHGLDDLEANETTQVERAPTRR